MAKLRHIAMSVPDPEKTAEFYCQAFDMKRVGARPVDLVMRDAYARCKTWGNLEEDVRTEGAKPIWDESDFTSRVEAIRSARMTHPRVARRDGAGLRRGARPISIGEIRAMGEVVKVANAQDVQEGSAIAVEISGKKIALFNVEGTFYAIDDTCTHRGGPLCEGEVEGTEVTCPWHGATFNLTNGSVLSPPAPDGVASYKVVAEGGEIKIEIP